MLRNRLRTAAVSLATVVFALGSAVVPAAQAAPTYNVYSGDKASRCSSRS